MNWERFEDDPLYSEIFTYWYDEWNSISEEVKNGMIGINIVNIRVVLLDIINEYELNQFFETIGQAFDLLVSVSLIHYCTYTSNLSTT